MNNIHSVYAEPAIAAKQRAVVGPQLRALREGQANALFQTVGDMIREIAEALPRPITLLDAGCGSAYYSEVVEHYAPGIFKYAGVDYNLGMVELARIKYPSLNIRHGDLCSLKYYRASDVVMSGACIAHIKDWKKALSELLRLAKSYLILHRNPIYLDDTATTHQIRNDYDVDVLVYQFNEHELLSMVLDDFILISAKNVCAVKGNTVTRSYLLRRKQ